MAESSNIDVKHIGIPNICFSLVDNDDDREPIFSNQRKKYGFDDSETWCLASTMCKFMIPRLKRFAQLHNGCPFGLTVEEWSMVINKIIVAFELIIRDDASWSFTDEEKVQVEEGLDLFREWFFNLWW